MKPSSVFLAENTNAKIETFLRAHHTVYIPVGATEQHGPHSAIGTDVTIPQEIARRDCLQQGDALVDKDKPNTEFPNFPETVTQSPALHTAFFFSSPGSVYRMTESGTWGDATQASAEKGEELLQAGVQSVINLMADIEKTFAQLPKR